MSSSQRATISSRTLFSSAHYYKQECFSHEENSRIFGACYSPYGHGHNYVLEVWISGPIDSSTGVVIERARLTELLAESVKPLDHHHLNFDLPEFKTLIPTTENITLYLCDRVLNGLKKLSKPYRLERLRLYETDDLWVDWINEAGAS